MKVLFAASEAYPFAMSGGLADVAGALPKALRKRFVGCRVVLPLYGSISEEMRNKMSICAKNESKKYDRKSYYNSFCKLVEQVTE